MREFRALRDFNLRLIDTWKLLILPLVTTNIFFGKWLIFFLVIKMNSTVDYYNSTQIDYELVSIIYLSKKISLLLIRMFVCRWAFTDSIAVSEIRGTPFLSPCTQFSFSYLLEEIFWFYCLSWDDMTWGQSLEIVSLLF